MPVSAFPFGSIVGVPGETVLGNTEATEGTAVAITDAQLIALFELVIQSQLSAYQPGDADLTSLSGIGTQAYGIGLLPQASESDARTYLGLGTMATEDTSGYATLVGGVLPQSQLPSVAITEYLGSVVDEINMLLLSGEKGDWCTRSDLGTVWVITGDDPSVLGDWTQLFYPASAVTSVNSATGAVVLGYTDVGAAPSSHTHTVADISDATVNSRSLIQAADYAAMRGLLDLEAGTDFYSVSSADSTFAAVGHSHTFAEITSTPTTLVGYGISDAYTKTEVNNLVAGFSATINNYSSLLAPQLFNPDAGGVSSGTSTFTLSSSNNIGIVTLNGQVLDDSEYSLASAELTVTPDVGFYSTSDEILVFQYSYTLSSTGGVIYNYVQKSSTYNITTTDYLVECTANTFDLNLPSAVGINGQVFVIKNFGTGVITVNASGAETIDGDAAAILSTQYESITLVSNGTNWIII